MDEAAVRALGQRLSNWGRWGSDDERGTPNFITPEKVRTATALARRGRVISLSIPFGESGPLMGLRGRSNPLHLMRVDGADDAAGYAYPGRGPVRVTDDLIVMPLQAATQWDSLAHIFYDGLLYNGVSASTVTSAGAARNAIDALADGIVSRGVLLDIARQRGVEWLGGHEVVTREDLERTCDAQGVEVAAGDVLLVRTGWWTKFQHDQDRAAFLAENPGLGMDTLEWLHERELAAVAVDNWACEVLPGEVPDVYLSFHMVAIRDMGLLLGELFDFDELAADCAAEGSWDCLFVGAPLRVANAVGAPLNPLAIR